MKTFILSLTAMAGFLYANAQNGKNEFRLECFSPILSNSMPTFLRNEFTIYPVGIDGAKYTRKMQSIGFTGAVSHSYKNIKIGCRLGFAIRSLVESQSYIYHSEGLYTESFSSRQRHFVSALFVQHQEHIKKISINMGLEMPFIYYGGGKAFFMTDIKNYGSNVLLSEIVTNSTMTTGSGYATGIGANIGLEYHFKRSMGLGIELCNYFLYTNFSKPSDIRSETHQITYDAAGNGTDKPVGYTATNSFKYSNFGFSNLCPRLYYAFRF